MSNELEHALLGSLIMTPSLLETSDLRVDDFSPGRCRQVFEGISSFWEDRRPDTIDIILLADHIGGNGIASFVSSLMDGLPKSKPEMFQGRVIELRRRRLFKEILRLSQKEADTLFKTGSINVDGMTEIRNLWQAIEAFEQPTEGKPLTVPLSSINARPVDWLWPGYFPLGKISLISGDPGSGKTWLALELAARISRGLPWPDGSPNFGPGRSIYLTVEDEPEDTLRPRIDSLGGDPEKIHIIPQAVLDLSDPARVETLDREVRRLGDVRLVVLDPILDFSGKTNPNAAEEVRALLNPLAIMAAKHHLALVIILHLNKSQTFEAIYRTAGSASGWVGKVRAAFMVFRDKDDRRRRYFRAFKTNLAPEDPTQFLFKIVEGKLHFERLADDIDLDIHLTPERHEGAPQFAEAVKFLKTLLADGPMASKDVFREGRELGLSEKTIRRAGQQLKAIPERVGGRGAVGYWTWRLL
jgi:hypothetical protein